jgi:hypothetical protein
VKSGRGVRLGGVGDVVAQGDDAPRRSRVGLVVGIAAVVALAALFLLPRVDRDEAAPGPTPTPSRTASSTPSPSRPVIGDLEGPRRTEPTGLKVFGTRGTQLVRLDVDTGAVARITGVGDLSKRITYVVPWGAGTAVVSQPRGEGGEEYAMPVATVFRLAPGAEHATRVDTAHGVLPGARPGDLLLVTYSVDGGPLTAVTYDARGRRGAARTAPNGAYLLADTPRSLILAMTGDHDFDLHVGGDVRTFKGRSILTATADFLVTQEAGCQSPCPTWFSVLHGPEQRLHLRPDEQLIEMLPSPGGPPLVRTAIQGPDQTILGERVYQLDVGGVTLSGIIGAVDVGPLHRVAWNHDGSVAFLQSNTRWACYTQSQGLQLLEPRRDLDVVGVI